MEKKERKTVTRKISFVIGIMLIFSSGFSMATYFFINSLELDFFFRPVYLALFGIGLLVIGEITLLYRDDKLKEKREW